ncbi:AI-2E family transporter [Rhodococcus sp. SRB_17]|uniref:AI-2E family transporter n=1 Tax=Rhodococcus sp. OK302 TaxID=1882769 RepID=UPI000B941B53|nr:AI-2E family transporter [Rhodococcus sp. OK302]NMM85821.1 AI-2E family transporter [Rhodococcus sp. SRB_17]OYD69578.1 putative PurR-regulated permease PerM [Rhodococcus sp. OK302]
MAESVEPPGISPAWSLPRGVIVLLGLASLVVSVAGMRSFASVIGPVFLALMLTVAVHPLPIWLQRKGLPRWAATLIALVAVYSILNLLVLLLIISVARLGSILPDYQSDIDQLLDSTRTSLNNNGIGSDQIHNLLSGIDASALFGFVEGILEGALGIFSNLLFVLVLLLFMAVDGSSYAERMGELVRSRPDIAGALNAFSSGTRKYLIVSTVFGAIVAVLDTGLLWALGIPLPVLWGLLSFITNYIPNIGFVLGLVPPALLALLQGGVGSMITVIVLYSVVNVVIQSVIQPKFVGDAVGLSVTLTFLSLVFWSWVLGPLGAILAIPLTLMAKALLVDIDPSTRWADVLLGGGPAAAPKGTPPTETVPDPEPDKVPVA